MKLALRGVMGCDGDIHAWPMLLADHATAWRAIPGLDCGLRARWRQWNVGGPVDFDVGATPEDRALVQAYVKVAQR